MFGGIAMMTRRDVLRGAMTAGAAAFAGRPDVSFARASQPSTPADFAVPEGACDCHVHTFDPQHFPYSPSRPYTPEPVSVEELQALHHALRIGRVTVVQTTVYGTDNTGVLAAMKDLGARSRGVAVIDLKTPDSALDEMDRAGIRGIRLNLETAGQTDPEIGRQRFQAAVERIKGRKWHIQIYARLSVIEGIKDQVASAPMPVVFDHFGGMQAPLGADQPGFASLMTLLRTGKAYVKISAPYRSSTLAPDYPDVAPLARALVASNPERILWGSDWPHPGIPVPGRSNSEITPFFQIDDGRMLNLLPKWVPDAATRKTILVDNPARLYSF
jgi:predicted TIM-barrel fold metal-dependent hydrolase